VSDTGLHSLLSMGARCHKVRPGTWRLSIPEGPSGRYRVAQLDDYGRLGRRSFAWRAPMELQVRARVLAPDLPGTWGFGLWNDPFSLRLGHGGGRRFPTLPNAAWFFYASPPNYLALADNHPARGMLAATFAAPRLPGAVSLAALPAAPWLLWRRTARLLRRLGRLIVREDAAALTHDPTCRHTYRLRWLEDRVAFYVDDDKPCFVTPVSPWGSLGAVMWIDNQAMAFTPDGRLSFDTLAGPQASLELTDVSLRTLPPATQGAAP